MTQATGQWPRRIVAGVDGRPAGMAALGWAAAEAYTHGTPLALYHCWQRPPAALTPAGSMLPPVTSDYEVNPAATIVLDDAVEHVRCCMPGVAVEGELLEGCAGPTLSDNLDPADLLVVGRQSTHRLAARLLASTASHLMAHARCAMVVVPPSMPVWHGPFGGHVVVGVDDSAASEEALRLGFAEAAAHGWPLAAVHVTNGGSTSSVIDETTLEVELIPFPSQYRFLQAAIEPWRQRYPDVTVRRACFSGGATQGLPRAAAGARLLVIGRHQRRLLHRPPLRLVDMLLARTSSPVALTAPVRTAPRSAGDRQSYAVR